MLCQGRLESGCNGVREFGHSQSHGRSEGKNRSVAGGMRKGWLHEPKPEDIPQTGQRNSFGRAVRPVESAVQEKREREEVPSLIYPGSFKLDRAMEKSRRDLFLYSERSEESLYFR